MFRVLLVNMPFSDINRPSLGLSLLKAGLTAAGAKCDIAYLNLEWARCIGVENYVHIDRFDSGPQLGEWIFAEALFGNAVPGTHAYYEGVLRPALAEPFGSDSAAYDHAMPEAELIAGLEGLRSRAREFLASCLRSHAWDTYDIVGFTSTFQQNVSALALARLIKAAYPKVIIAFGGANCEGPMGVALHRLFPFVDVVCSGEGDRAFVSYVTSMAAGGSPISIDGVIQRVNGETTLPMFLTSPVRNMDALPVPDYGDFLEQRRSLGPTGEEITLPFESSRGCWWGEKSHCTFCGLNGGTMSFRRKTPDRFLDEIAQIVDRNGIRNLSAADNIIDMRYFQSVLPQLANKGLQLKLFYETKANLQRHHVRLLREAGVVHIQPGIESLSTDILRRMRKGVQAYQNVRLLRLCAEYLVHPSWNILGGFPGEEPCEYMKQAELIPLLAHLTPPVCVTTVRLDRFSPLFERAPDSGIRNVGPSEAYRYVYPHCPEELKNLVYFFKFEYADGRDPNAYMHGLRSAVNGWKANDAFDRLVYLDDGEVVTIADGRPMRCSPQHELRELERCIYLACEDGVTLEGLKNGLSKTAYRYASGPDVEAIIDKLLEAGLLIFIDQRYLSLAIGGNYRVEALARCLATGAEVATDLQRAVRRLFDSQTTVFGRQLSACLAQGCVA